MGLMVLRLWRGEWGIVTVVVGIASGRKDVIVLAIPFYTIERVQRGVWTRFALFLLVVEKTEHVSSLELCFGQFGLG